MDIKDKRNIIGLVGWFIVSILLGLVTFVPMIAREWYQSYKFNQEMEKEDIRRYAISIIIGTIIHYWILKQII